MTSEWDVPPSFPADEVLTNHEQSNEGSSVSADSDVDSCNPDVSQCSSVEVFSTPSAQFRVPQFLDAEKHENGFEVENNANRAAKRPLSDSSLESDSDSSPLRNGIHSPGASPLKKRPSKKRLCQSLDDEEEDMVKQPSTASPTTASVNPNESILANLLNEEDMPPESDDPSESASMEFDNAQGFQTQSTSLTPLSDDVNNVTNGGVANEIPAPTDGEAMDVNSQSSDASMSTPSVYSTPKWNPKLTPSRSQLREARWKSENKKKIRWVDVNVYYFDRQQGVDTVPGNGEIALGMADRHHSERLFTLTKKGQPFIDLEVEDNEQLSSGEEDAPYFERCTARSLQPIYNTKQRHRMLKVSGANIQKSTNRELEALRQRRRNECGCSCRDGICMPDTCECSITGIKCQIDESFPKCYPCTCLSETCDNPKGRVEFDREKVAAHHQATMQRSRDMHKTGLYATPTRRRLDSHDERTTYCEDGGNITSIPPATPNFETPPSSDPISRVLQFEEAHEVLKPKPTETAVSKEMFLKDVIDVSNNEIVLPQQPVVIERGRSQEITPKRIESRSTDISRKRDPTPPRGQKSPIKIPATPTRIQPRRSASLTRLPEMETPTKPRLVKSASNNRLNQLDKVTPVRIRRSSSASKLASTDDDQTEKATPPRIGRASSVSRMLPFENETAQATPPRIGRSTSSSRLNQMPRMGRSLSASRLSLASVSRMNLSTYATPTRQFEIVTPTRTPSPEDEPHYHHKFPVTPVYSRSRAAVSSISADTPPTVPQKKTPREPPSPRKFPKMPSLL